MREVRTILLLCFLFLSEIIPQQTYTLDLQLKQDTLPFGLTALVPKNKPVVSLALSGGGARGLSQVGVLKALEEAGIRPDLIVGTSMGSIVGGLYSAGTSIRELDSIARATDWQDLLTLINQSGRSDLFIDQKVTEDRAVLTLRLDGLNPVLPTSFNDGQKLANYLNILAFNAPVHANESFDNFPIKFRAVCTDLVHGTPVVLDKGSLSNALRASSSVTFFLAPVKLDSLILVDGGLVANVPVDIAYNTGASFVLAVNTTSPLWGESELNAPWIIADQIVSIPIKQANNIQLQKADYLLTPELNTWLATDFDKVDSLISAGYNFTKDRVEEIKSRIDDEIYNSLPEAERYFKNIVLDDSLTNVEKEILSEYEFKDSVSNKRINADLYKLYDTGIYKKIAAKINSDGDKNILKIDREENPIVKDISLIGVSLIQSDKISEIFSSIKDKPFYAKNIIKNLIELISLYRKQGYSLAEIQSVEFNAEEKRLRVFVDEGIISRINVVGNEKTMTRVILREFPFQVGDYFKLNLVDQGLTNLRSTRLFENIDVYVTEQNGQNVMEISVTEKPSGFLRLGFRLDNEYKLQVGLDIREENLFGTGAELGLILFGGSRNRALILEQKANRLFSSYLTYKINAYYKFNDVYTFKEVRTNNGDNFEKDVAGEYRQIFYGLSLGVGTQIGKFGNLIFEGRYGFDEVKNIRENTIAPYKTKIVSLRMSTTVDTQDKYPFPQKGIFFYGFYETAFSILGGELGYSNLGFDVKGFIPLAKRHIISPRAQIGFADKTLPLSQQYSLGGLETFFGMRDYEYRGRQIFLTSLMYRYKLPVILFFETYLKFRYDLGSTWEVQEQIRFKDLKHGIGGAIAFDTPIGPAEFAAGRSFLFRNDLLNDPISWGEWKFYFSIGYYY